MSSSSLVLDTSLFVNPAAARVFGATPTEAFTRFLELARETNGLEFLMPPTIYRELMHFAEENRVPKPLLLALRLQPPRKHETCIPAIFVYNLVDDARDRVDRGLRLSERHVREALQMEPPVKEPKGGGRTAGPRADAEAISRLRESYRRIMREGALDSRADVDLLILAYETNGLLASADQGVIDWATELGVAILPHDRLKEFLEQHRAPAAR